MNRNAFVPLTFLMLAMLSPALAVETNGAPSHEFRWAESATKQLGSELRARLEKEIAKKGLAEAISVCRTEAPRITRDVAKKFNVRLGRTSHRLRNPKNAPPSWVKELQAEKPQTYSLPGERMAFTFPIRTAGLCVMCHGDAKNLSPDVKAKLARLYPKDLATGFQEGDLRGQFWVELTPKSLPPER